MSSHKFSRQMVAMRLPVSTQSNLRMLVTAGMHSSQSKAVEFYFSPSRLGFTKRGHNNIYYCSEFDRFAVIKHGEILECGTLEDCLEYLARNV
jgi:hypothetical protein